MQLLTINHTAYDEEYDDDNPQQWLESLRARAEQVRLVALEAELPLVPCKTLHSNPHSSKFMGKQAWGHRASPRSMGRYSPQTFQDPPQR